MMGDNNHNPMRPYSGLLAGVSSGAVGLVWRHPLEGMSVKPQECSWMAWITARGHAKALGAMV